MYYTVHNSYLQQFNLHYLSDISLISGVLLVIEVFMTTILLNTVTVSQNTSHG